MEHEGFCVPALFRAYRESASDRTARAPSSATFVGILPNERWWNLLSVAVAWAHPSRQAARATRGGSVGGAADAARRSRPRLHPVPLLHAPRRVDAPAAASGTGTAVCRAPLQLLTSPRRSCSRTSTPTSAFLLLRRLPASPPAEHRPCRAAIGTGRPPAAPLPGRRPPAGGGCTPPRPPLASPPTARPPPADLRRAFHRRRGSRVGWRYRRRRPHGRRRGSGTAPFFRPAVIGLPAAGVGRPPPSLAALLALAAPRRQLRSSAVRPFGLPSAAAS